MPSKSPAQHRLMAACDHGANYAACPSKAVAHEFTQADIGRHFADGGLVDGAIVPGNIDPYDRPVLKNNDGSVSTTQSFSIPHPSGGEVLLPQVINGERLTKPDAVAHYLKTGEHLGIFPDWQTADAYATQLHNDQSRRMGLGQDAPTAPMSGNFAGAKLPDVAKLLRMAVAMHNEAKKASRSTLRGLAGITAKPDEPKTKSSDD